MTCFFKNYFNYNVVFKELKNDKKLNNEIENKLNNTLFDNIDSLLYDLIYEKRLGIIVVIDEQTEDLNVLFKKFSDKPEVIEVKKYQCNNTE